MKTGIRASCWGLCVTAIVSGASAQNVGAPARPVPVTNPGTWIGPEDYPAAALVARAQGAVGFTLKIDAAGAPTDCSIVSSSGSTSLDEQTCRLLRERARFDPAADGSATRSFSSRLHWVLPAQAPAQAVSNLPPMEVPSQTTTSNGAAELTVGSDGIVKKCEPFDHPYMNVAAPPDLCSSFPVGARYGPPAVHSGKPVRRRIRIQMTIESGIIPGN